VGVVGVFLGADTTTNKQKKSLRRVLGLRTAQVVARNVNGIYAPWDSAPVSVDGVWLGGWYVACGGGGSGSPVMGPVAAGGGAAAEPRVALHPLPAAPLAPLPATAL
jgi:hypothetical protein